MVRPLRRLPDAVRSTLGLSTPVLAFAQLTGDAWAVGTRAGLHLLRGGEVFARAWTDVDGARLDAESDILTLTWVDGSPETALALAEGRRARFPRLVHHQVQASVVHSESITLPRGEVARVVLRRGGLGELFTQVIGSGAVDLDDPAVARLVDAAEARVRAAAGL